MATYIVALTYYAHFFVKDWWPRWPSHPSEPGCIPWIPEFFVNLTIASYVFLGCTFMKTNSVASVHGMVLVFNTCDRCDMGDNPYEHLFDNTVVFFAHAGLALAHPVMYFKFTPWGASPIPTTLHPTLVFRDLVMLSLACHVFPLPRSTT